ncbi:glycoside hydrolase family 31 protein [Myriangium duriaei CBS 260.36]|uniref:alpha-D-xyloside xylohydrolase n=1 Tax=Myriangium duriaei CBS 260.36 TaxID=1168546 RepID=A0A9P4J1Q9_9PEZI|nr:glycoside hydrolase family 31 protein [Myriangium duriaei CBS 260.36]
MRFRDGMWLAAADKHIEYAEEVYDITKPTSSSLSLLCPTRQIHSRGDTLNRPTITVDLEAVGDGIIAVTATHWHGELNRGPHYDLFPDGPPSATEANINSTDKATILTAGPLAVSVSNDPHTFDLRFHSADGKHELTSLLGRSVAFAYDPPPGNQMVTGDMTNINHYMVTQSTLSVGEGVYGLGERFGAWNKVGQKVELWNADGGTSSDQAYKNISFWMSNRGYGIFIEHLEKVELEIGSERCCRVQTSVEGQRLRWNIIYGPTPKDILRRYTLLTGRATQVPTWSFGLWLSTSFTTDYDDDTVKGFLEGMKDSGIPVSVFHYDCFWLRPFHWCDFTFSPEHFPDPAASISSLRSSSLTKKISIWTNPYLAQRSPLFAHAAEKGYLLKRPNGSIWQWDLWQTGMGLVDFTNPAACTWYAEQITSLLKLGVDSIKTDFGERIPTKGIAWHDSSVDPEKMHNYYAHIYNKTVFDAVTAHSGPGQTVLFARAAVAGTQRYPLVWGGDCESTFEAMGESLRGGLSLGLCGYTFWSVDIGGFEGTPDATIYKRWVQFGLLCSHSRLHGSNSYRVPWLVDGIKDEKDAQSCTAVLRRMTVLKARLMPYLLAQSRLAIAAGLPLSVRAMALEFPDDKTAWTCDAQFMLGSSLLVAPIFDASGEVEFYLPAGKWTSLLDDKVVKSGPGWVRETHDFTSLPIYVREGTVLVLGKDGETRTEYDFQGETETNLFFPETGSGCDVVDGSGKVVSRVEAVEEEGEWKAKWRKE